jgi:8-oxo-dGTP pyrophosphatase MutT (NUDIX family)
MMPPPAARHGGAAEGFSRNETMTQPTAIPFDFPVPIVSAIIERQREGEVEVLVQTRWKPGKDPKYSGTMEIPAGGIGRHENVYDALKREVFEETGLNVIGFRPDVRTGMHAQRGDEAFAFVPFCCQQQTKGKPRIGFVFVCVVEEAAPRPAQTEVRDIRWIKHSELRRIFEESPDQIFTFQLGALDYYLSEEHKDWHS